MEPGALKQKKMKLLFFQEELEPGERKEQKQKEFSIPMCLANTAPKNLQDGTYEITVSATSYQTYKVAEVLVQNSEIRYVEDIYMVERHDDFNTGSVEGTITDAVTGDGITETAYIVRKGWNNQTGDAVTEGVFENADYTPSMENGNYTLEISKRRLCDELQKYHSSGETRLKQQILFLYREMGMGETAGELRIVLTWGEEPWDLDSHLACYSSDKPYHIWFGQTRQKH